MATVNSFNPANGTGFDGKTFTSISDGAISDRMRQFVSDRQILPGFSMTSGGGPLPVSSSFNQNEQAKMLGAWFNNDFTQLTLGKTISNIGSELLGPGVGQSIGIDPVSNAVIPAGMYAESGAGLLAVAGLMTAWAPTYPIAGEKYTQPQATQLNQQVRNTGATDNGIATLIQGLVNGDSNSRAVAGDLLVRLLQAGGGSQNSRTGGTQTGNPSTGNGINTLLSNAGLSNTSDANGLDPSDPGATRIFNALGIS